MFVLIVQQSSKLLIATSNVTLGISPYFGNGVLLQLANRSNCINFVLGLSINELKPCNVKKILTNNQDMDFQCETTCLIYVKSNLLSYMTINMFKHYHKNILIKKYINAAVKEATNYSDWIIASEFFK